MYLSESLRKKYTQETLSARDAQRQAEFIAFGPIVFQVSRLMVKWGILEMLRDEALTIEEIARKADISVYASKCLMEASLTIGTVLVDEETNRFTISKTGWFLLNDPATRVNIDFNHDVNYEGLFRLEESLKEGRPAGLEHFGNWPTVYEGLSQLPEQAQKSWFAFDHFYSDSSFEEALKIVFARHPKTLMDVGGNTGRWAMQCVNYDKDVHVTIVDLPQQLEMMREQTAGKEGADRIHGFGTNLLDRENTLPQDQHYDAIWMSQFLDCFGEDEIESILERAAQVMDEDTTLYIMETLWDRQKYEPAAFCLTQISLYFTDIANGNSKMYHSEDLIRIIEKVGLQVKEIHDNLGQGHSIIEVKKK
ncbi:class I SAM-dependent methyltransferase [Segatella albensis]|uniref:class I SAM-dependent methyltransferase n=1 Tax=Segatella albensis TaxID=77768 RepID=UPI000400961F|nr:class I SAM-dependent methyltransferase [Segatella albensis]